MENQSSEPLVVQSNDLLNGRYEMSVLQFRIFFKMISELDRNDQDFKEYNILAKDLIEGLNLSGKSIYAELSKTTKELIRHVCTIRYAPCERYPKGAILQVPLISSALYILGSGTLQIKFAPELKPYLLELKENFTKLPLHQLLNFKSAYSIRIYQLLKQYHSFGKRTISIDELRFKLGIEKIYPLYADLKKRVLDKAQKELANTDIPFDFQEIKTGKKVTAITFYFDKLAAPAVIVPAAPELPTDPAQLQVYNRLTRLGLSDFQAKEVLKKATPKEINPVCLSLEQQKGAMKTETGKEIKNFESYCYGVMKKKYGIK